MEREERRTNYYIAILLGQWSAIRADSKFYCQCDAPSTSGVLLHPRVQPLMALIIRQRIVRWRLAEGGETALLHNRVMTVYCRILTRSGEAPSTPLVLIR